MTSPGPWICDEPGCTVVKRHDHCKDCREPCEVGDEECPGCWAYMEEELRDVRQR